MSGTYAFPTLHESPPSRGAWIEISKPMSFWTEQDVAPLAGGVD